MVYYRDMSREQRRQNESSIGQTNTVRFLDHSGQYKTLIITPENARKVLWEVFNIPQPGPNGLYNLRRRIVQLSRGSIETVEAFVQEISVLSKYERYRTLSTYLADPISWLPERRVLHENIFGG